MVTDAMGRVRRSILLGPSVPEDSGPGQGAWLRSGGSRRGSILPSPQNPAARPPLSPPRAQSPPSVPPPAPPPPSVAAARRCRRTCSPAGTRRRRRDGQGSERAGQRPRGQSLPAAPAGQAGPTRRLLPPLASSPRHRCAGGQSCGPASSEAGTPRRELKVGTSRAAARRDPAPASGARGFAGGRSPGAPCGYLGARERPPWRCGMHPRGRSLVRQCILSRGPRNAKRALTLHAGFFRVPREELECRGVFPLLVHCQ